MASLDKKVLQKQESDNPAKEVKKQDNRLEIKAIAEKHKGISMPYHKTFWAYKGWLKDRLMLEEDYFKEFRKFQEVF